MADKVPQTRRNHVRVDPSFHYFFAPLSLLLTVWAIIHLIRHPGIEAAAIFGIVVLLVTSGFKTRIYALRVQDRVIRLEERLRLAMLLPEPLRAKVPELTESQLIALRFASDDEVAPLAERTFREKLSNKQIKELIRTWRPDYWRV